MNPSPWFFSPRTRIYGVGVEVGGATGGPRGRGRAPTLVDRVWAPWHRFFRQYFYIFQNNSLLIFRSFRELLFLHKNNTMAILLKTASIRVSSIQIMQVRVQNKGKSVWKSRYDGDLSLALLRDCTSESTNPRPHFQALQYRFCARLLFATLLFYLFRL